MAEEKDMQEQPIVMGSRANEVVQCHQCGKELKVEDRHSFDAGEGKEVYFCSECLEEINAMLEEETKNPNIFGATALGILASIVCGIIWYMIVLASNTEWGILTIGIGFVIGWAVHLGSGKKRGTQLQIIATVLTLLTLILSEMFIGCHFIGQAPETSGASWQIFLAIVLSGHLPALALEVIKNAGPIGIVIWLFGVYFAYSIPKPTRL